MSDNSPPEQPTIDLRQVLAEIEQEVTEKRTLGELSSELERELDLAFARFAPVGVIEGDFEALLERAEKQAFIDLLAPNESVRRGVPQLKRVIQKSVRWYMRYIAEQFGAFGHTITKAVRKLGDRVQYLEQLSPPSIDVVSIEAKPLVAAWQTDILDFFKGAGGRVLHTRCGAGRIVASLRESEIDAYGVDPDAGLVSAPVVEGLDLRSDEVLVHLRALQPAALDGMVLTGCVDDLPKGAQMELMDKCALVLAKGARLVLCGANPLAWDRGASPVVVDLAAGRPLHAETWAFLLAERGFSEIEITNQQSVGELIYVPGGDESVAGINANIDRLNAHLYPPASYLITARR